MNEETISKVLTEETDIAKMSRDDFVELLKCLGRMYFARVMNCVDGTAKYDKEWTALSSIFNRVAEAITQKPSGNCAKLREALKPVKRYLDGYTVNILELRRTVDAALTAPTRNCDRFASAEEAWDAYDAWVESYREKGETEPLNEFGWLFAPAAEKEGGAK